MVASSGFSPQTCGPVSWWTPSWRRTPAGCRTPAHAGSWNHPALCWKTWTWQLLRRSCVTFKIKSAVTRNNLRNSHKIVFFFFLWRLFSPSLFCFDGQRLRWRLRIIFHICIKTERGLTKQLTAEEGRQLVPVTHTRILCSSQWSDVFLWWAFYNSCFRSLHHLVRITPLTQKPHARANGSGISTSKTSYTAFPSTTKATEVFRFLLFFFPSLCRKLVSVLSRECFCNISERRTHKGTDLYTRRGLIYSTCFQCPLCDIYRNMGSCVIGNPDCGFEIDSWLCLQIIW